MHGNGMNTVLYLNADHDSHVHAQTLAGIRRYIAHCGWDAKPVWEGASLRDVVASVSAGHGRVVGCIAECPASAAHAVPYGIDGVPGVLLHPPSWLRNRRTAYVTTDNAAVARVAFRELSTGHPAAYAVAGINIRYSWSRDRIRAFRTLCRDAGMRCFTFDRICEDEGERSADLCGWIAKLPRHTAVFAVSDFVAVEVAAAARSAGRAVPRELTLLGVDNDERLCERQQPSLSSMQLDHERAGFLAAKLLAEGRSAKKVRTALISPLLAVRRESTLGHGRREWFVPEAVETIRREACEGLTVAELAGRFRCSRRLFDMRFREAMGCSALDEILRTRFERVFAMLLQPGTPIDAIADFCGFGCQYELRKLFRLRYGCSMSKWRRDNEVTRE